MHVTFNKCFIMKITFYFVHYKYLLISNEGGKVGKFGQQHGENLCKLKYMSRVGVDVSVRGGMWLYI